MRGTQILAEGSGDAWLEGRRRGLGGTDTVVLMGAGSYDDETPYFVWLKKVEGYDIPDNPAMERGRALEPVVLARYIDDTGHKVVETGLWQHAEHEMVLASPDALVVDEHGEPIGGVECKTTLERTARKWNGECPARFEWQSRHYMAVLDVPWWDVVALVVDTWEVYYWRIERDMDKERALLAACSGFWRTYIEPGIPPEPDNPTGAEVIQRYRVPSEGALDLDSHSPEGAALAALLEERRDLAATAKQAKERQAQIDMELKALAAEHEEVMLDGQTAYTWKAASRSTLDAKRLRAEHPEIAAEFVRSTTYRTLSVK